MTRCFFFSLLPAVLFCSVSCTAERHRSLVVSGDVRDQIIALEKQVKQHPESLGPSLKLSLLYGLSVRLDEQLSPEEKKERATRAITLVRPFFDTEMSASQVDVEKVLHVGFILAQNYLSIGSNDMAWAVFDELTTSFGKESITRETISAARKRLVERVNEGYPLDAENPWVVGLKYVPTRIGVTSQ